MLALFGSLTTKPQQRSFYFYSIRTNQTPTKFIGVGTQPSFLVDWKAVPEFVGVGGSTLVVKTIVGQGIVVQNMIFYHIQSVLHIIIFKTAVSFFYTKAFKSNKSLLITLINSSKGSKRLIILLKIIKTAKTPVPQNVQNQCSVNHSYPVLQENCLSCKSGGRSCHIR